MPVTTGLDLVAGPREVRAADRPTPAQCGPDAGVFDSTLASVLDESRSATSPEPDGTSTDRRTRRPADATSDGLDPSSDANVVAALAGFTRTPIPAPPSIAPPLVDADAGASPTLDEPMVRESAAGSNESVAVGSKAAAPPVPDPAGAKDGHAVDPGSIPVPLEFIRLTTPSTQTVRPDREPTLPTVANHVADIPNAHKLTANPAIDGVVDRSGSDARRASSATPDVTTLPDLPNHIAELTTLPDTAKHTTPPDTTTLPDAGRSAGAPGPDRQVVPGPDVLPSVVLAPVSTVVGPATGRADAEPDPPGAGPTVIPPPTTDAGAARTMRLSTIGAADADPVSRHADLSGSASGSTTSVATRAPSTSSPTVNPRAESFELLATTVPGATRSATIAANPTNVTTVPPSAADRIAVADQLVSVVRPLTGTNGVQSMTLDLHPADLGRVRLEIRVEGALVHVAMSAERQTTSDLLRQTMPEFRRSLGAAGLTPGNIALGADASSGRDSSNGPRNPHSGQDANLAWNQNRAGQERRSTPDNPRSADADIRTPDDFRSVRRTSTDSSPVRLSVDLLL